MIRRLLATVGFAAVILASSANSALASWSQCLSGYVCLYTAQSGASAPYMWTAGYVKQSGGLNFYGLSYDNNISSIRNRSNGVFRMYDAAQCNPGGYYFTIYPSDQKTLETTHWNDKITSMEEETDSWLGACPNP